MNELRIETYPDKKRLERFCKLAEWIEGIELQYRAWQPGLEKVILCFSDERVISTFFYQLGLLDAQRKYRISDTRTGTSYIVCAPLEAKDKTDKSAVEEAIRRNTVIQMGSVCVQPL